MIVTGVTHQMCAVNCEMYYVLCIDLNTLFKLNRTSAKSEGFVASLSCKHGTFLPIHSDLCQQLRQMIAKCHRVVTRVTHQEAIREWSVDWREWSNIDITQSAVKPT